MSQKLYLWKICQNENNDYDTYSDAIVVASDEESARNTHPIGSWTVEPEKEINLRSRASSYTWSETGGWLYEDGKPVYDSSWTSPAHVKAILVGEALPGMIDGHVVCASFHAG